jgi:hypothetical protein
MRIVLTALLVLQLAFCCATGALAMAAQTTSPAVQQPNWPAGLADLLNSRKWVYAYWINAIDHYYYSGDAKAFSAFVAKFSKLGSVPELGTVSSEPSEPGKVLPSETTLQLVLHAGKEMTGAFDVPKDAKIPFEWKVETNGWVSPGADTTIIPVLELWTGGRVKLAKVKMPLNVEVITDGTPTPEIAQFIAAHDAKRKAEKRQGDS